MDKIIDCQKIADKILLDAKLRVERLQKKGIIPTFATILVGKNKSSTIYVERKTKKALSLGIKSVDYSLEESVSEKELLQLIDELNKDDKIHGILLQLPLPKHLDSRTILNNINPLKDIDGLHPLNIGYLVSNQKGGLIPCTAKGIWYILQSLELQLIGKKAVMIGKSNLVGLPTANILLNNNLTVSICHKSTVNLRDICKGSDIIIVATGYPKLIDASFIKEGAIVIDVGISNIDGKIIGDVDFQSVLPFVSKITRVPKGVGLLTVASLMENIILATEINSNF